MKTIRYLLIIAIALTAFAACAYASMDDKSDRMSSNQSNTFSPGYINATMQKTQSIIRQAENGKSSIENANEAADNKLSNNVAEDAATRVTPELKKKTSSGEGSKAIVAATQAVQSDSTAMSVKIGAGVKIKDSTGTVIGETIGTQRYIYAGFNEGKKTITQALVVSQMGDIILVKAGNYDESFSVKNGVSLYGGYSDSGVRNIDSFQSIINGSLSIPSVTSTTVIDGFNMNSASGNIINIGQRDLNGSSITGTSQNPNLIISHNVFNGANATGIYISNPATFSVSYNKFNTKYGIQAKDWGGTGAVIGITMGSAPGTFNLGNDLSPSVWKVRGTGNVNVTSQYNDFYSANPLNCSALYTDTIASRGDYFSDNRYSSQGSGVGNLMLGGVRISQVNSQTNVKAYAASGTQRLNSSTLLSDLYSLNTPSLQARNDYGLSQGYSEIKYNQYVNSANSAAILKELIKSRMGLMDSAIGQIDMAMVQKIVGDAANQSAVAIPIDGSVNPQDMKVAMTLANILKNPTSDQKLILDTMTALLNDVNKQAETSQSPEVKKAQDDLLQVVANILIAQAMPDLLKEGDMSNIKGIFQDMNTQKDKIMMEYNLAIEPYYGEIKKLLAKNLAVLQLNNIVSKSMAEEELNKMEPNEVNKLLEKLRKVSNKNFEEEYILQQEAKYRKEYIDPNRKLFEEKMKAMLEGFTARLSKILETTKK